MTPLTEHRTVAAPRALVAAFSQVTVQVVPQLLPLTP
jgi:hypothetical protein